MLEAVRGIANCRWSTSLGWIVEKGSTISCTACNSWQLYHSGTAQTLRYITLLLFARRQDKQCTCDVILRSVCSDIGGFLQFWRTALKVALFHGCGKLHCLWEMLQLW